MIGKKKTLREQILRPGRLTLAGTARDKAGPVLTEARDRAVTGARGRPRPAPCPCSPTPATRRRPTSPTPATRRRPTSRTRADRVQRRRAAGADRRAGQPSTRPPRTSAARPSKRGKAVAAALKGEVEAPEKKHRGRTLLVRARSRRARVRRVQEVRRQAADHQLAVVLHPAARAGPPRRPAVPSPVAASVRTAPSGADDVAASDPGEAASDAADVPHDATTPDNPVEDVDVEKN